MNTMKRPISKHVFLLIFSTALFFSDLASCTAHRKNTQEAELNPSYVLALGKNAKARLKISEKVYGSYAKILFGQLGLKQGHSIAVIGCGTGENLPWLSKHVGPEGRVLCADLSVEQLKVAQENAKGLKNVNFLKFDVVHDKLDKKFDFVTSRFLLVHVKDPIRALKNMASMVRKNGYLLCEEHDTGFIFSCPLNQGVLRAKRLLDQISEDLKVDYEFGRKLFTAFHKIGLKKTKLQMFQPIFNQGPEKQLLTMSIKEAKKRYVPKYISEEEMNHLILELNAMANDPSSIFSVGGLFQVYAKIEY